MRGGWVSCVNPQMTTWRNRVVQDKSELILDLIEEGKGQSGMHNTLGYSMQHYGRSERQGGGVAVVHRNSTSISRISVLLCPGLECLLDLSVAFGTVNHCILLRQLLGLGLGTLFVGGSSPSLTAALRRYGLGRWCPLLRTFVMGSLSGQLFPKHYSTSIRKHRKKSFGELEFIFITI